MGPIEDKVRSDVDALVTEHPMGEALAEVAFRLARLLDGDLAHTAIAPVAAQLSNTLAELARLGVRDDDLGAELSVPFLPSAVRDEPGPAAGDARSRRRGGEPPAR